MILSPINGKPFVTQQFGGNPKGSHYAEYGLKGHDGIDLHAPVGTPVYASHDGFVRYSDEGTAGYGLAAFVTSAEYRSGFKRQTIYGHLSKALSFPPGAFVSAGDLIGLSGESGDATGPHLHWGYRLLDPQDNKINYSNGYHGWIDVSKFSQNWTKGDTLA